MNIHHLSKENNLVCTWMNELRDIHIQNDRARFRKNIFRIGQVIAYEISKTLSYTQHNVTTPLGVKHTVKVNSNPVIGTIFRAGFPLYNGLLDFFDHADSAFVAAYRKHHADGSFEILQSYVTCPPLHNRTLIVADPMLATGASLIKAIDELLTYGNVQSLHIAVVIASKKGIETIPKHYPDAHIWVADIDDELNKDNYIVPGLGDAGDLCFGSKMQS